MIYNPILNSDSYKMSHYLFYPEDTEEIYSYMESRGGRYKENLFFGLQGFLAQYLTLPVHKFHIEEAADFAANHGVPFNREGWEHILKYHQGFFPVEIRAVKEGSVIPTSNILLDVRNTGGPETAFITSYIETMALRLWYPITVATRGLYMKRKLKPYFEASSDTGNMDFAVLDFSARGCSSFESNQIGGAAHLVNFKGSDSMGAVQYVKEYYGDKIQGYSVPATEHSIMCAYGEENELESFKRMIERAPEGGILSVVSDTWNIYAAVEKWTTLREMIRNKGITLVIRPDSGDIKHVLREIFPVVAAGFGTTKNSKGYHVLNDCKILWGDGMNENTIVYPYAVALDNGISADSVIAGSGGGLMQADIDRDTSKFAFKASNIIINGISKPIAKNPVTDPGKVSKSGKMKLVKTVHEGYKTLTGKEVEFDSLDNQLKTVYRDGVIYSTVTMDEIRDRVIV